MQSTSDENISGNTSVAMVGESLVRGEWLSQKALPQSYDASVSLLLCVLCVAIRQCSARVSQREDLNHKSENEEQQKKNQNCVRFRQHISKIIHLNCRKTIEGPTVYSTHVFTTRNVNNNTKRRNNQRKMIIVLVSTKYISKIFHLSCPRRVKARLYIPYTLLRPRTRPIR